MKLHEMEHLIGEAVRDADLRPEEIPAIDLYLDQIISLVTDKRMEGSAHYRDRELTKTMINNYSLLQSQPRKMPNFWMVRGTN